MKKFDHRITIIVFLVIIVSIVGWIFTEIPKVERKLQDNIKQDFIADLSHVMRNLKNDILRSSRDDLMTTLAEHPEIRRELESKMSLFITETISYAYVLYRDETGRFRFMLDGSKTDKSGFGQKFDIESDAWNDVYDHKKETVFTQENLTGVWLTFLSPIIHNGKVQGVLAIDFSQERLDQISSIVMPIKEALYLIFGFILLFLLISVVQLLQYLHFRKKSFTDSLTRLFNRHYLNEIIAKIDIAKYQIMLLDIDRFKIFNDTYGHQAGDTILKEVAKRIKEEIREHDTLIRYGGEEFLILIAHDRTKDENLGYMVAERIRQRIKETPIPHQGQEHDVTISAGVNRYPQYAKDFSKALKIADEMLYLAKSKGRDRVEINSLYDSEQRETTSTIHEVKEALEETRIFCVFQPIFDSDRMSIYKHEALVRMTDKNGEIVPPGAFLPAIYKTSVYKDLTKRVLSICFEKFDPLEEHVSINLTLMDILDEDIIAFIESALADNTDLAARVTFELLENEEIRDFERVKRQIRRLQKLGAKIAIDDFGKGYANFIYLLELRVDSIKIDGSLIKDLDTSSNSRHVLKSIAAFAADSDIELVAEFVHKEEIYTIVRSFGINKMQGYFLSEPGRELVGDNHLVCQLKAG